MKIKIAAWILVAGFVAGFAGGWAKITHQAYANNLVTASTILQICGIILLAVFVLQHPVVKEFLKRSK